MLVTLEGPDDLGYWFLTDDDGNAYPFVTNHQEHLDAVYLGWQMPEGVEEEDAIMAALEWLNENIGEEFEAPDHVEEFFVELYTESDEEE